MGVAGDQGLGPTGLSVPLVTVLDARGRLLEADQRALVRHVIQQGQGANILFYMGTTGEWDRVSGAVRQSVIRVCADEVTLANVELVAAGRAPVASWAGVTAPGRDETLANLQCALAAGADAAVIAPLAIRGVDDPVAFIREEVGRVMAHERLPIYLYDNEEIAVDPARPYLTPEEADSLARLDFVRGIKVSAPIDIVDHHLRSSAERVERGAPHHAVYVGYASLVFELFDRPTDEPRPAGLVSGPANCLPREWVCAWQACSRGDRAAANAIRPVLDAFRALTFSSSGRRTIAALKRALVIDGVISSAALAEGTPDFAEADGVAFERGYADLRLDARERVAAIGEQWVTRS